MAGIVAAGVVRGDQPITHVPELSSPAAARTNDVLVTSTGETQVGAVVLVKGTVRTDKDFGAGYAYPVMIEATELSSK